MSARLLFLVFLALCFCDQLLAAQTIRRPKRDKANVPVSNTGIIRDGKEGLDQALVGKWASGSGDSVVLKGDRSARFGDDEQLYNGKVVGKKLCWEPEMGKTHCNKFSLKGDKLYIFWDGDKDDVGVLYTRTSGLSKSSRLHKTMKGSDTK